MMRLKTIMALLVPMLLFSSGASPRQERSRTGATKATIAALETALTVYHMDCGTWPTKEQKLIALAANPGEKGWNGPYVENGTIPNDSWGTPFRYDPADKSLRVRSAGPDLAFGTADDIDQTTKLKSRTSGCGATQ